MLWFWLSALSVAIFVVFNILQRKLATDSDDPRALTFAFNLAAAGLSLVIYLLSGEFTDFSFPNDISAWIFLGIALLCYGLTERIRFLAAKLLDASLFSNITNISIPIGFILSIFLYREIITWEKTSGTILIVIALILATYSKSGKTSVKGVWVGILFSVLLGIAWALDKKGATNFSPVLYNLLVWTLPLIIIYIPYIKPGKISLEFRKSSGKIWFLAILCVAGYMTQLKAVTLSEATKVMPLVQTSTVFTVLGGVIFLKEKEALGRKIIAALIAVVGVFLLV